VIQKKGVLPRPVYLSFDDKVEGDAYVAHLEKLLAAGVVPDAFKSVRAKVSTVSQAIFAYLDGRDVPESDTLLLGVIERRIGQRSLAAVDFHWVEEWVAGMKADALAPSTIRHHVGALARCFDWVSVKGYLPANPLRMLPRRYASGHKAEVERDRRLSLEEEAEVRRILAGGKPEGRERAFALSHAAALAMLFTLALESGMRLREMFTLDLYQVDVIRKTVFLDRTKNGSKRQVPLTSVALRTVKDFLIVHEGGLLFPWWDGDEKTLKRTTALLSQQFARVFDAAGCGDFTFHGLRHEATCRLYERTTLSDVQIAKILGWQSLGMAMRYANLRGSDLSERLW
jgi:integrase